MKKSILILTIIIFAACKKDDWVTPIKVGTQFHFDYKKFGNKPWIGPIPKNPFTVDSVIVSFAPFGGYAGYHVHSLDSAFSTILPPTDIRGYIIN